MLLDFLFCTIPVRGALNACVGSGFFFLTAAAGTVSCWNVCISFRNTQYQTSDMPHFLKLKKLTGHRILKTLPPTPHIHQS